MRRLTLLLVVPLAAILLTGCVRIEIVMRVADDGSGMISFLTAIDSSAMDALGALDPGASDAASGFTEVDESSLPPGATAELYEEGTFVGSRVMIPFAASGDVAATIAGLAGDASDFAGPDGLFERFALESDGDGWLFEAQFPQDMMGDVAGADAPELDPALLGPLLSEASFTVRVALPGTVVEHNADRIEGDELIWDLGILDPGSRPMMARTELGGGEGISPALIVAATVVVVAAAAGGFWAVRRRRAA